MQLMSNGRVRRTDVEWRVILARWKQGGLSPEEFCKKENLRPTSFRRWHDRLGSEPSQAPFVPVTTEGASMVAPSSWTLQITLPNGVHLQFQG